MKILDTLMPLRFLIGDLWSQIRTKPSLALGREIQNSPPYFINLEPTSFCNLNCTICSLDGSRKNGHLRPQIAELALNQAYELKVTEIRFFLAGEPLFNPHLAEYIRMAKDRGFITNIHTNATFMPQDRITALLEAGLDKISFSFDGEHAEEYEKIRIGAKFDLTFNNIINFLKAKKARGQKFPLVTLQVIKLAGAPNCNIITKDFKNLFQGLPVDEFLLLNPFVWPGQEQKPFNRQHGPRYYTCMIPWNSLSVVWDGRVVWCCGDLNGIGLLGDIRQQTLKEIWNGEKIRAIRRGLAHRTLQTLPLCRSCEAVYHWHHPVLSDLKDYLRQIKRYL